ncbi:MAG: hypothetical protein WC943_12105 [Elusimicrobiota bacterium]|jgi:hypothetical protein
MKTRVCLLAMIAAGLAAFAHAGPRPASSAVPSDPELQTQQEAAPAPQEEAPAPSQEILPPEREAANWASKTLGAETFDLLVGRRYLVIQGPTDAPRLQDGQWEALKELGRHGMAAQEFAEAYARYASGNPPAPAGAALEFASLLNLPDSGLMTPGLRSAARIIIAAHEEFNSLDPKALSANDGTTLYETPWGDAFAARTRADLSLEPESLADAFFDEHFAAVRPNEAAVDHFKRHILAVHGRDLGSAVEADARNASLSQDLRGWIAKYLADQRRLAALERYTAAFAKLDLKQGLGRQIAELASAARSLVDHPDFVDALQSKRGRAVPAPDLPRTRLTSAGLHLHQPVRLERHELGDTAVLTAGYWIDGLAEGESAEVAETTFADYGKDGFGGLETRRVRRANGGLYAIRRELPIREARPFTFRLIVSGDGTNTLSEKAPVAVSDAFDRALDALAAADAAALDCRFKEADEAYAAFTGVFAESAKAKKQYADLVAAAAKRRSEAQKNAAVLAKLEEAIASSRADLSPEKCDYQTSRTEAAIKQIASMPAGCDRYLSDLQSQLQTIQKRRADAAAFRDAVDKARDMEKSCQLTGAVDALAQSLAILDANPSVRCGSVDEAAKRVEADLPAARQAAVWAETLAKSIEEGETPPHPGKDPAAASLKTVNAALARIPTLPNSRCFAKEKEELLRIADSSGLSLTAPEDGAAVRLLPDDRQLAAVSGAVTDELRRISEARNAAQHRKAQLELPAAESSAQAPAAQPKPAGKAPQIEKPKPAPKPVRRSVKRQAKPAPAADEPAADTTDQPSTTR